MLKYRTVISREQGNLKIDIAELKEQLPPVSTQTADRREQPKRRPRMRGDPTVEEVDEDDKETRCEECRVPLHDEPARSILMCQDCRGVYHAECHDADPKFHCRVCGYSYETKNNRFIQCSLCQDLYHQKCSEHKILDGFVVDLAEPERLCFTCLSCCEKSYEVQCEPTGPENDKFSDDLTDDLLSEDDEFKMSNMIRRQPEKRPVTEEEFRKIFDKTLAEQRAASLTFGRLPRANEPGFKKGRGAQDTPECFGCASKLTEFAHNEVKFTENLVSCNGDCRRHWHRTCVDPPLDGDENWWCESYECERGGSSTTSGSATTTRRTAERGGSSTTRREKGHPKLQDKDKKPTKTWPVGTSFRNRKLRNDQNGRYKTISEVPRVFGGGKRCVRYDKPQRQWEAAGKNDKERREILDRADTDEEEPQADLETAREYS